MRRGRLVMKEPPENPGRLETSMRGGSLVSKASKLLNNLAPVIAAAAVSGVYTYQSRKAAIDANAPDADPTTKHVSRIVDQTNAALGDVLAGEARNILGAAGKAELAAQAAQSKQLQEDTNQNFILADKHFTDIRTTFANQAEQIANTANQVQVVDYNQQAQTVQQMSWNAGAEQAVYQLRGDAEGAYQAMQGELLAQREANGVLSQNVEQLQNTLQMAINAFGMADERSQAAYRAVQEANMMRQNAQSNIAMQQASFGMVVPGSMALSSGGYNVPGSAAEADYTQYAPTAQPLGLYNGWQGGPVQPSMDTSDSLGWGIGRGVGARRSRLRAAY